MSVAPSVLLVGIGGYGNTYAAPLLDADPATVRIAGCVDPDPQSCRHLEGLRDRKIPIYPSMDAFYARHAADLAVLSTPLQLHASHACFAMNAGSHVLCEKPMCTSPSEIRELTECQRQTGSHLAIGYQWSFSTAIQRLKADILAGDFGEPIRLKTMVLWPRDLAYYARNGWAGRTRDAMGRWVLDSPVNNACAHHLHNMFYVLGNDTGESARPELVTAERYRANAIENYDTAAVRCITEAGVELLFLVSHATSDIRGPEFRYEFEKAVVEYSDGPEACLTARFHSGELRRYGSPSEQRERKLWLTLDAIKHGSPSLCGVGAAASQTWAAWTVQQSLTPIEDFDRSLVDRVPSDDSTRLVVRGLQETLQDCYARWMLPSEQSAAWARRGVSIPVEDPDARYQAAIA